MPNHKTCLFSCKEIVCLLLYIIPFFSFAQEYSLTGKLVDENKQPLESCEIIILKAGFIKGSGITNELGFFDIKLTRDVYSLRAYFLGNVVYATEFEFDNPKDLGEIVSFELTNELVGVEIIGKKKIIESMVDRTVFNVENSVRSVGTDALELVKGTPGVNVQNNVIGLIGKSSVAVMIDDRIINLSGEDLNNYLRSINSENVKSIEVITTPPAKYAADGNSGLINIRLKKTKEDSWSVNVRNMHFQNSYYTFIASAGMNYKKDRFSMQANIGKQEGASRVTETRTSNFDGELWDGVLQRKDFADAYRGAIGFEYELTDKASVGVNYIGLFDKPDIRDYNITSVKNLNTSNVLGFYRTDGFEASKNNNQTLNAFYTQKLDTLGKSMNIDIDYLDYYYSRNRDFETSFKEPQNSITEPFFKANNTSEVILRNYSARLDFDWPTAWATLNFGGRLNWIDNSSDVAFFNIDNGNFILDPLQTNIFDYKETTQAIYASFQKKLSEKWQTQVGLRYETTQTDGKTTSIDPDQNQQNTFNYNQLFPTAYLLYQHSENHSYSANYSKRINRPIFWNLNPFRWYMSPFLILEGNPFLQPSFTDNFELNYNYKENLSFKAYASITKNFQAQLPNIILDGEQPVTELFWENYYNLNQYGLTITHYFNKFDWWESINTFNVFYNDASFNIDINANPVNGTQFSFNSNNSFVMTKKRNLFAEVNFNYDSRGYRSFFTATSGNQLDVGIRYSLRDKGWNFAIYGDDLFRSSLQFYEGTVANVPQRWSAYMDERMVRLVITYKFGNRKLSSSMRESGNEEEKGRLK
jgi:hypothetical protein